MQLYGLLSLALVAGVVSFTSPCALPLLPGYVSWVSGLSADGPTGRAPVLRGGLLFVLGFTLVFTALGTTASTLGMLVGRNHRELIQVGGMFVIVMGLASAGILRIPLLSRQLRIDLTGIARGPAGALPLGAAFAIGWTPCVGPVLAGVLATAASTETAARGALLLIAYSAGLGIPFLLVAWGVARGSTQLQWARRHGRSVQRAGGLLLVGMGVLMVAGNWTVLLSRVLSVYARIGWPPI